MYQIYERFRLEYSVNISTRSDLAKPGRTLAFYQLGISSLIVLIGALIIFLNWELTYAVSALAGGAIGVIPNVVFALKAFKYAGASASKKVVESFFSGVKLKLGLTAFLFALTFKFFVIEPVPFFGMFCLTLAMPLLLPLFLTKMLKIW
jgi:ATP synthase protein I